jgi:thiaminase
MNNDKKRIFDLITSMFFYRLELDNKKHYVEANKEEFFEDWCEGYVENEIQIELMNKVKNHVDNIIYILEQDINK